MKRFLRIYMIFFCYLFNFEVICDQLTFLEEKSTRNIPEEKIFYPKVFPSNPKYSNILRDISHTDPEFSHDSLNKQNNYSQHINSNSQKLSTNGETVNISQNNVNVRNTKFDSNYGLRNTRDLSDGTLSTNNNLTVLQSEFSNEAWNVTHLNNQSTHYNDSENALSVNENLNNVSIQRSSKVENSISHVNISSTINKEVLKNNISKNVKDGENKTNIDINPKFPKKFITSNKIKSNISSDVNDSKSNVSPIIKDAKVDNTTDYSNDQYYFTELSNNHTLYDGKLKNITLPTGIEEDTNGTEPITLRTTEDEGLSPFNITLIILAVVALVSLISALGMLSVVFYRRYHWNKPQTLSDKCSNADSTGYIDDSTLKENSEEMYSLDNDSFLNSIVEGMTIPNYWADSIRHTKL